MKTLRTAATLTFALTLCALAPACYTLLKHPQVREADVYQNVADRRCSNCHQEDELWSFHQAPNQPIHVIGGYAAWAQYYDVPWWYDDYWYYDPTDPSTIPLPSRGFRPEPGGATGSRLGDMPPATKTGTGKQLTPDSGGNGNDDASKMRSVRPKTKKEKRKPKGKS